MEECAFVLFLKAVQHKTSSLHSLSQPDLIRILTDHLASVISKGEELTMDGIEKALKDKLGYFVIEDQDLEFPVFW